MKTIILRKNEITEAVSILKTGGIIVYPTETAYGLGCDATNKKAVRKIFVIKKRAKAKKLPVIVSSVAMAKKYAVIRKNQEKMLKKKYTTIVFPAKKGTTALRISCNNIARSLTKKLGKPIVATSANISGSEPIYEISAIKRIFSGKVNAIIDAGNLKKKKVTRIINATTGRVLRK
ncbi:MAG TPA: L-threonylcarbamoyladenylate synthase [archaeon]|nr:L-threonylcarbamoyladenylate synthase [archaeon]